MDSYWRWWVVHLWVEGVWELIMGGILSFLLIKLTGVDREIVEKWLYVIVGFTFLSGILGTGHHYYFIGTPTLLAAGSAASSAPSSRSPSSAWPSTPSRWRGRAGVTHPNRMALMWTVGCALMSFVGAGFLGFAHTLPQVNLLHPRHAGHRDARAHGLLGRVRDAGAGDHHLRDAAAHRTQAL